MYLYYFEIYLDFHSGRTLWYVLSECHHDNLPDWYSSPSPLDGDAIVAFNTLLDRHVERLRSMQVEINLDIMGQKACSCSVLYRYIIKALDIPTMARRLTSLKGLIVLDPGRIS